MKQTNLELPQNQFDETFTDKEITLIDNLIETSAKSSLSSEEELNKIILENIH